MTNTRTGVTRIVPTSRRVVPGRVSARPAPAETVNIPIQPEPAEDQLVDDTAPEPEAADDSGLTDQPEQLDETGSEDEGDADDMGKHSQPLGSELDADPETSLVGSLCLHMLSEHAVRGALHLDEEALAAEHEHLHENTECDHAPDDLRFRPGLALKHAMLIRENGEDEAQDEADADALPV